MSGDAPRREIASAMTALLEEPPGDLSAIQAVERIRAWHEAMRRLSSVAEAQVMASCWAIRRAMPDRERFQVFVGGHLDGILEADRAWLMAETWDVARKQRSLHELAVDRPSDAIGFVREFVEAGREEDLRGLDENDRKVAEILASPSRKRTAQIRVLLESHQERLALQPTDPPPPPPPPPDTASGMDKCIEELRELAHRLDGLAAKVPDLLAGDARNRGRRGRILPLTDLAIGALDNIAAAAIEANERFGDGG